MKYFVAIQTRVRLRTNWRASVHSQTVFAPVALHGHDLFDVTMCASEQRGANQRGITAHGMD